MIKKYIIFLLLQASILHASGEKAITSDTHEKSLINYAKQKNKKQFICGICSQVLATSFSLSSHKKRKHTTEYPFTCPYCSYRSKVKYDINFHIKIKGSQHIIESIKALLQERADLIEKIETSIIHLKEQYQTLETTLITILQNKI